MTAKGKKMGTEDGGLIELPPGPSALDLDVQRVLEQTMAIQKVMMAVMRDGEHYGVIPGTEREDKKGNDISRRTLYQPGADKLCLLFRLRPRYLVKSTERDDLIAFRVRARLYHIPTGELWGEGMGSCNSREAKYVNQSRAKLCPKCQRPAISKGAKDYGGGWYCATKKDGCNAKFAENDPAILQQMGQVQNDKLWDLHNTMLKMACKRAKVAAVLTATAASDIFTQDLEDLEQHGEEAEGAGQAEPKPKNGNGNGNGGKQHAMATPIQVRDLNLLLNSALVGFDVAKDLKGNQKDEAIFAARLRWVNSLLGQGRSVQQMSQLTSQEIESLITVAKQAGGEETGGKG